MVPSDRGEQEGQPCAVTSGSCDLNGVTTETSILRLRQSKVLDHWDPAGCANCAGSVCSRHALFWATRRPRSTLRVISAFTLGSTGGGGERRKAHCLCVTSGEPSGNNGNMALNGAGEDLTCGSLRLRGTRGCLLRQDSPDPCASLPPEVDDFSWEPPTEAETKVLQARRERQDRISRLMGDYLLRGYRMLGETCADCGVRRDSGPGIGDRPHRPFPNSPLWIPLPSVSPLPSVFSGPRRSSSKINSGKSTAWLVRSSTQTWIKIIRVRGRVCLKSDEKGLGTVGLGGDSGVCGWGEGKVLPHFSCREEHLFSKSTEHLLCARLYGGSELNQAYIALMGEMSQGHNKQI